jgi:mannose-6-phosphate isomerase-like protein (cupin superfamily)
MDQPFAITEPLARDGFAGPLPAFDAAECARLVKLLERERHKAKVWAKAAAVTGSTFFETATDPRILTPVRQFLGEDVILWGASLVIKRDAAVHPFHTDIESADPSGGFITVWIGLENTSRKTGLRFVRGSHIYGAAIQETNHRRGIDRHDSTDETTLSAAREYDAAASIAEPDVGDGDALFFDGRIWHGSHNRTRVPRTALLLQYARADKPVFIPRNFDWPFEHRTDERPPVLLVSGRAPMGINRMAKRPQRVVANAAHPLPRPVALAAQAFASIPHFEGQTPALDYMECHTSLLAPGASPHPLHSHDEEEILLVVSGEAEIHTADDAKGTNLQRNALRLGDFGYYPAHQFHTIVNASAAPVMYTMFKWRNEADRRASRDALTFARASSRFEPGGSPVYRTRVLEFGTRWLKRLQAHRTIAMPLSSYAAHADSYDVAIVLLEGAIETLGQRVDAPAVLYHPAGELHGLAVPGDVPARYVVFEFDGLHSRTPLAALRRLGLRATTFAKRAVNKIRREILKRLR